MKKIYVLASLLFSAESKASQASDLSHTADFKPCPSETVCGQEVKLSIYNDTEQSCVINSYTCAPKNYALFNIDQQVAFPLTIQTHGKTFKTIFKPKNVIYNNRADMQLSELLDIIGRVRRA